MASRSTKAMWDFFALSGGEILSKIAGFIAFAYLARTIDPADYGAVELTVGLLAFFVHVVEFGYGPVGSRVVAQDPDQAAEYAARITAARMALAIISVPCMILVAYLINQPKETFELIVIVSFALFAVPFYLRWLLQGLEHMTRVSLGQAVRMIVFMLGVVLFVRPHTSLPLIGIIELVAAAATAGYFLSQQMRLALPVRLRISWPDFRSLSIKATPIGFGQIVWSLNQNLPTLLIASVSGAIEVAWYAAAMRIVNALLSFAPLYHFNLYPAVVKRLAKSHDAFFQLAQPSYRLCAWAGACVALVGTLLAETLTVLAFGAQFSNSATAMSVLVWVVPINLLSGHARWALVATDQQRHVLFAQLGGVLSCALACWLLIPALGSLGGSFALVISALCVWLISHVQASRLVGPMPLAIAAPPLLLAVALIATGFMLGEDRWWFTSVCITGFCLSAPLIDRRLLGDIQTLMHAKADVETGNA